MKVDGNNSSKFSYEKIYEYINKHLANNLDTDRNTIFEALDNANNDDEDKSTLNRIEVQNFLVELKNMIEDSSETLKTAINNTYEGVMEFFDDIKKSKPEAEQTPEQKPADNHNTPEVPLKESD